MKSENLTDEQLFRGIARTANAMTALIHQQLELDPAVNTLSDAIHQAKLRESNTERIGKLERNITNTLPSFVAVILWNNSSSVVTSNCGSFAIFAAIRQSYEFVSRSTQM